MMSLEEQVEYAGLAAAVGRLMATLKQTEAALAEAVAKLEEQPEENETGDD